MTGLLEAPTAAPENEIRDAAPPRRRGPRLRADLRLARRQVWRTKGSSALVMLLVMLPVAGLAGGAISWQSHMPTREQQATLELGANQVWIEQVGGADPSRWQPVDEPYGYEVARDAQSMPVNEEGAVADDPSEFIAADATLTDVQEWGAITVETATGIGQVAVTAGDVWDPAFDGRFLVLDGDAPTAGDEAMVSPGLLERLGADIGDDVVIAGSGEAFTITGTMRRADARPSDTELFLPAAAAGLVSGQTRWYSADWQPGIDELAVLNQAGFIAYAHDLVVDPPAGATISQWRNDTAQANAMLLIMLIVVVFTGYLIVMLAGAAFAVAARRQQRSLAVAASVGAARGDVFRIVVLQGTVLGTVAGILGVALGAAGAWVVLELTDSGAVGSFWGNWGYNVPWALVGGILIFAVVVGTVSAIAPARAATRGDVLGALRGSRRPPRAQPKRPLWGLLVMLTGLGAAIASGLALVALNAAEQIDFSHPLRTASLIGIVVGPIVFQIGFLLAGRWVLTTLARPIARLGMAPRIAARDAAANPSRTVPAFAAIAVCVFIAAFVLSVTALTNAAGARQYWYNGPLGSLAVSIYTPTADGDAEVLAAAEELLATTSPVDSVLVSTPRSPEYDLETGTVLDPDWPVFAVAGAPTEACPECGAQGASLANGSVLIVAAADLSTLLDTPVRAATLDAYRTGAAVVTDPQFVTTDDTVVITEWTQESIDGYYMAMSSSDLSDPDMTLPAADAEHEIDAVSVDVGRTVSAQVLISPETARILGMDPAPTSLVGVYDEPLTTAEIDQVAAAAASTPVAEGAWIGAWYETGPDPDEPWLWLIVGAAGVLVIAASAVCLGLTRFERRPDDATLTAVGGSRMLRRRINLWQAVIVVGVGSVVGTAAGVIPAWGYTQSSDGYMQFADMPWPLLAVLAVGLPVGIAIVAWIVPPRHPDLTRRTAIA